METSYMKDIPTKFFSGKSEALKKEAELVAEKEKKEEVDTDDIMLFVRLVQKNKQK
jgi:hypothetical protein